MKLCIPFIGILHQLPQFSGHSEDGYSEHDAVLHSRGQSCGRGTMSYNVVNPKCCNDTLYGLLPCVYPLTANLFNANLHPGVDPGGFVGHGRTPPLCPGY